MASPDDDPHLPRDVGQSVHPGDHDQCRSELVWQTRTIGNAAPAAASNASHAKHTRICSTLRTPLHWPNVWPSMRTYRRPHVSQAVAQEPTHERVIAVSRAPPPPPFGRAPPPPALLPLPAAPPVPPARPCRRPHPARPPGRGPLQCARPGVPPPPAQPLAGGVHGSVGCRQPGGPPRPQPDAVATPPLPVIATPPLPVSPLWPSCKTMPPTNVAPLRPVPGTAGITSMAVSGLHFLVVIGLFCSWLFCSSCPNSQNLAPSKTTS